MTVPQDWSPPESPYEPWLRPVGELAAVLSTDPDAGLDEAEAAHRLGVYGPNRLEASARMPEWRKFLAQFADPLIFLLLAAVVVSLGAWWVDGAEGVPFDAVVIGVIVVLNAVIGYVQEARAEQAVAALQKMATPTARVVRNGQEREVPTETVVPGDVLVLAEGDSVSADGRVAAASALTLSEASLTGESEPVAKSEGPLVAPADLGDRTNMVFRGTAVTRGRGRAIVTSTGMASEMGKIARLLGETEDEATPLQKEVNRIGRMLGVAVLVITGIVVATILLTSRIDTASDYVGVFLVGVSLAVAAVPEGLPAILSVVLALGVQRMARQNAIVKQLASVETLGSASVVCSDKTGTLTRSEMTVERVVTPSSEVHVTGTGYRPEGEFRIDGRRLDDPVVFDEVAHVLGGGSLASDASLQHGEEGWRILGDPTEAALLVAEEKLGIAEQRRRRFQRVGDVPFDSERKMMSTLELDRERDERIDIVTKGAPDVLLARCRAERVAGAERELTPERRREILTTVERLADEALRTLAVAYRALPDGARPASDPSVEHDLVYLGLVGIIDPPRTEAREAIREAQSAGIRVVMITGDHPRTARRIAADLGIADRDGRVVSGQEIEQMDDGELRVVVTEVSVYARVAPVHKLRIIDALQAADQIVSMTGDGVNDAPALKSADIGVAMGITGTDVSKEAADMILADDNFATIVAAVRQGRAIFANIRKFLRFLLSSNIGEVCTMFFGVLLGGFIGLAEGGEAIAVPLLATQILWINLLTDSAPALAMGVDPPPDDVMQQPPRSLADRVIDARMWRDILWVGFVMSVVTLLALDLRIPGGLMGDTGDIVHGRTMAFTTLVLAQLFNTFNARSDHRSAFHHMFTNPLLWAANAFALALQVAVVQAPFLNQPFGTTPLPLVDWLICAALASGVLWAEELRKALFPAVSRPALARATIASP